MAWIDTLTDNQTGAWTGPSLADTRIPMLDGTSLRNSYDYGASQTRFPSFTSIEAALDGHNQYFETYFAASVPWLLVYPMQGHASVNAAVEVRNMFCQVLKSDDTWEFAFASMALWGKRVSGGDDASGTQGTQTKMPDGILKIQPGPAIALPSETSKGRRGYELWASDWDGSGNGVGFYGKIDRTLYAQTKAFCFGAQVRRALWDVNGVDDRASSRFVTQIGNDLYASPNPGYRYISDGGTVTNTYGAGYPYGVADGNNGRWRVIDSDDWQWVTCVTVAGLWGYEHDTPPPWGNYSTKWAYNKSPYAITQAAFEANVPLQPPGDTTIPDPEPTGRLPIPTRGAWFAKTSGGSNNWAAMNVANVAAGKVRRRRGIRFWS